MVTFLVTSAKRGNVAVDGPVTGIKYLITPSGTPVNDLDVPKLLKMTGPPCCGETLPFGGQVKLFGKTAGTTQQVQAVPSHILHQPKPKKVVEKKLKKEPVVLEEEPLELEDKVEVEDKALSFVVSETNKVEDKQEV